MPTEKRYAKQAADNARSARARANAGRATKQQRAEVDWDAAIARHKALMKRLGYKDSRKG